MAKLGRYSANRIKCQSITTATYTMTNADCGTMFSCDRAAGIAITLPTVAKAGTGWWCRIVIGTNFTGNGTITAEGALMRGGINELETDNTEDGPSTVQGTVLTITHGTDTIGDYVELYCDGTYWYVSGQCTLDACWGFDA